SEENRTARVAEDDAGARVFSVEDTLDRHRIHRMTRQHFAEAIIDLAQPIRQRSVCVRAHDAALDQRNGAAARTGDDAVSRRGCAGIDSEYYHASASAYAAASMSALECTFC